MQQSQQEVQNYQEDEIDLKALVFSLIERKFLILGLTAFVTVLAYLYSTTMATVYQANSSFTSPTKSSVVNINKLINTNETKNSVFASFLTIVSSQDLHREVFVENDFLTKFNKDNNPIDNVDNFIEGVISSIAIKRPQLNVQEEGFYLTEKPYSISINGYDPEAISNYLDLLITRADTINILEIIKLNQQKISIRLSQIAVESKMLLKKSKQDRLNQIDRIMEEDGQKLREINDKIEALKTIAKQDRLNQIDRIMEEDGQRLREINDKINRARYKAKEDRLNMIEALTDSAKLAKSLGIIENNFKFINNNDSNSDFTIAIGETMDLPEWYWYGEKALLQRIKILVSRTSDDPFIPELVTLKNQINEIQNNNLLITLKARQDDSPFIKELNLLSLEAEKIKSSKSNILASTSSITLGGSLLKNLSTSKRVIIILAFVVSLILSILFALIMSAINPRKNAPT